jgi:predicted GIY-YIG superfamily endonuclease
MKMAELGVNGVGPKAILSRLGRKQDFSGCYVLFDKSKPIYVGISRSVMQRLLQHVKGKTHFDASLAYRIACKKHPHAMERNEAMTAPAFQKKFEQAKSYLKSLDVAFIEIQNDLESYLFEVYCAMELDTHEWNTFRTH